MNNNLNQNAINYKKKNYSRKWKNKIILKVTKKYSYLRIILSLLRWKIVWEPRKSSREFYVFRKLRKMKCVLLFITLTLPRYFSTKNKIKTLPIKFWKATEKLFKKHSNLHQKVDMCVCELVLGELLVFLFADMAWWGLLP